MSLPYRSKPLKSDRDIERFYKSSDEFNSTRFGQTLAQAKQDLKDIIDSTEYEENGLVLAINGTWGSGKTSFVNQLKASLREENAAIVSYDSLYYGNVSEATSIFIKSIFDEVKEQFGVKLDGSSIAKNISPKLEVSNGLPKLSFDFKMSREPTEVIKSNLEVKLRNLPGKMIVIIDDIDRVDAGDVVHFLRLVRVLKELPNFIVILPVDKLALENLLKSQNVANPRRYLEKLVDASYDIDPEQGNSKDLFFKIILNKFPNIAAEGDALLNLVWDLYLWELSLGVIKQYETSGQQRFTLSIGSSDPTWQMIDPTRSSSGDLLVRKFFELTSVNYGSESNYVMQLKNTQDANQAVFMHYQQLFSNSTFTDFMYTRLFPSIGTDLRLETQAGANMMTTQWWADRESIIALQPLNDRTQKSDYRIQIPDESNEDLRRAYFDTVNSSTSTLWDSIRALAGAYLPRLALTYLAPRTLNRVIAAMDQTVTNYTGSESTQDLAEIQRSMRRAVESVIDFSA